MVIVRRHRNLLINFSVINDTVGERGRGGGGSAASVRAVQLCLSRSHWVYMRMFD